jgi:hypothetical protein
MATSIWLVTERGFSLGDSLRNGRSGFQEAEADEAVEQRMTDKVTWKSRISGS